MALPPYEGSNPSLSAIHRKRGLAPLFLWINKGGFEPEFITSRFDERRSRALTGDGFV